VLASKVPAIAKLGAVDANGWYIAGLFIVCFGAFQAIGQLGRLTGNQALDEAATGMAFIVLSGLISFYGGHVISNARVKFYSVFVVLVLFSLGLLGIAARLPDVIQQRQELAKLKAVLLEVLVIVSGIQAVLFFLERAGVKFP
jgi:hypothetical protein